MLAVRAKSTRATCNIAADQRGATTHRVSPHIKEMAHRGKSYDAEELDGVAQQKSLMPTYHLGSCADDADLRITGRTSGLLFQSGKACLVHARYPVSSGCATRHSSRAAMLPRAKEGSSCLRLRSQPLLCPELELAVAQTRLFVLQTLEFADV